MLIPPNRSRLVKSLSHCPLALGFLGCKVTSLSPCFQTSLLSYQSSSVRWKSVKDSSKGGPRLNDILNSQDAPLPSLCFYITRQIPF